MEKLKTQITQTGFNIERLKQDGKIDLQAYDVLKQRNKEALSLCGVGCSSERQKELIEAYKECFELFIPSEKWDEATLFLDTYNCGLAKDMAKKQRYK